MESKQYEKRKNLRLKDYDYSQDGLYFITICTAGKNQLFGHIHKDVMQLNDAGFMIEKHFSQLAIKYPAACIIKSVVMPNHVHLIVKLESAERQKTDSVAIPQIVQWIKTRTTCAYIDGIKRLGYKPFQKRLWQRNYYDHIVRNDYDFERIWTYVDENIIKWSLDDYYQKESETESR